MSHKVGHVDFYPNNGRKQPGCKADKFKSFILEGLTEGKLKYLFMWFSENLKLHSK